MILIDTHTHLYLDDYNDDRTEMVQRALDQQVQYMLLPHIDTRTSEAMHQMARQFPNSCLPMMGLHPTSVKDDYLKELDYVEKALKTGTYCAIGEVGIDLYWDTTFQSQQEDAFKKEIEWANQYKLPLVIHTRNSMLETLKIVSEAQNTVFHSLAPEIKKGVFHCYSGDVDQAWQVIELGYYLGIGGVVSYKNSIMAKVVEAIPLEHILLETDAPFLSPVPKRGMRNESAFVYHIAQKIADIKGISIDEVAEITTSNAKQLFQLP